MHESLRSKGGPSLSCKLSHKTDMTPSYPGGRDHLYCLSRIGGSIQRSHVYIPYILWLFKSTVLLINLFEFGLLFISEFSTKFSLINLFEFGPLFISEFSTKFSTASLIDFVQRSPFWIRSILRNSFENVPKLIFLKFIFGFM